jgi:hypothetical protein
MTPDRCHTTNQVRYTKSEAARVAVQSGEVTVAHRCCFCGAHHVAQYGQVTRAHAREEDV